MRHARCLLVAAIAALLPAAVQAQKPLDYPTTYPAPVQTYSAPAPMYHSPEVYAPAPLAAPSSCSSCGHSASCGHRCWSFGSRLKAWFSYKDCGECKTDCHACTHNCSTSLFHFFLRDCAYQPSNCCARGGYADGSVNPAYSRSVFPVGHVVGGLPTGMPGGCGTPGCGR
jgi:hypothetical protein